MKIKAFCFFFHELLTELYAGEKEVKSQIINHKGETFSPVIHSAIENDIC